MKINFNGELFHALATESTKRQVPIPRLVNDLLKQHFKLTNNSNKENTNDEKPYSS